MWVPVVISTLYDLGPLYYVYMSRPNISLWLTWFSLTIPGGCIPQILTHIVCRIDQNSLHTIWLHTPFGSTNIWLHPSISFGRVPQISLGHIPLISLIELDTSLKFPLSWIVTHFLVASLEFPLQTIWSKNSHHIPLVYGCIFQCFNIKYMLGEGLEHIVY